MTANQASPVTLVTGPLRSGTSCVTGLLEQCGYDLGKNLPVLRNPTSYNPRGHFELGLLFTINQRLCLEASGGGDGLFIIPETSALAALAAQRSRYFQLFINKFDGNLCKDPLMCLTWPYWQRQWPELTRMIFCLRHPWSVAASMAQRYGVSLEAGLLLWETYTRRFFRPAGASALPIYIFDFDTFCAAPAATLHSLLQWLETPMESSRLDAVIAGFFGPEFLHQSPKGGASEHIPADIQYLYLAVRNLAGQGYPSRSPSSVVPRPRWINHDHQQHLSPSGAGAALLA